jgi:hypothetical protein
MHLANILWAASKAPMLGSYRRLYAYTRDGAYWYDPNTHGLTFHSTEVTREGAFSLGYEAELVFDAGLSYMFALLEAVSLSNSDQPQLASCPKGLGLPSTRLFFAVQPFAALTSQLVAHSSVPVGQAWWLPDPCTGGKICLEAIIARPNYTTHLTDDDLTTEQISQLLWAGYGCTSHYTSNGRAGLTVPSAYATYYLTGRIYLVHEGGLYRYINRNPITNPATRDHRLEPVEKTGGRISRLDIHDLVDLRASLTDVLPDLPKAGCYLILCLDKTGAGQEFAKLEVGFVAANLLLQATALDLGCHLRLVTTAEQAALQAATGIPMSDLPQLIVSIGHILKADTDLDGRVDLHDLAIIGNCWRSSWGQAWFDPRADIDRNGAVDRSDLAMLAGSWLGGHAEG